MEIREPRQAKKEERVSFELLRGALEPIGREDDNSTFNAPALKSVSKWGLFLPSKFSLNPSPKKNIRRSCYSVDDVWNLILHEIKVRYRHCQLKLIPPISRSCQIYPEVQQGVARDRSFCLENKFPPFFYSKIQRMWIRASWWRQACHWEGLQPKLCLTL